MLGAMAREFFAASPLMMLPVIALLLFLCAFTLITIRALRRKPAELEPIARLPLADSDDGDGTPGRTTVSDHREHDPIQGAIVHEYDGIKEADNKLPQWWLWSFYLAIAFSFAYWIYYEAFGVGDGPLDRYSQERLAALDTGEPVTDELLGDLADDRLAVRAGERTFGQNCAKCHGSAAEGNIGPNLTDEYWIGGHAPVDIYQTIIDGRSGKGMPPWGLQLGPGACKQVAAYLLSIQNSNVPGKEPQGEKVAPEAKPAAAAKTARK